jgi:hypothetical protein
MQVVTVGTSADLHIGVVIRPLVEITKCLVRRLYNLYIRGSMVIFSEKFNNIVFTVEVT